MLHENIMTTNSIQSMDFYISKTKEDDVVKTIEWAWSLLVNYYEIFRVHDR